MPTRMSPAAADCGWSAVIIAQARGFLQSYWYSSALISPGPCGLFLGPRIAPHREPETRTGSLFRRRTAAPPHKGLTFGVGSPPSGGSMFYLILERRQDLRVSGAQPSWDDAEARRCNNSWFRGFNSRLGEANSRFELLREFAHKRLIHLTLFTAKRRLHGGKPMKFPVRREKPGTL